MPQVTMRWTLANWVGGTPGEYWERTRDVSSPEELKKFWRTATPPHNPQGASWFVGLDGPHPIQLLTGMGERTWARWTDGECYEI